MRYTQYRGLTAVTKWVRLKFAAMNLKKFAIHKDILQKFKDGNDYLSSFLLKYFNFILKLKKLEIQSI